MNKEKQIEQMAKDLKDIDELPLDLIGIATILYEDEGWRKQEWISVDDRLPENGLKRVLVFLRDSNFTKYIGENKIDTDRYIDGKWVRWGKHVTHWMPLPEPPKMKGGAE